MSKEKKKKKKEKEGETPQVDNVWKKKKRKTSCLRNVWIPANYVNTPTRRLETRETFSFSFSSLLVPPLFYITSKKEGKRWEVDKNSTLLF